MPIDLARFKSNPNPKDRYSKQLARLRKSKIETACIVEAVTKAVSNLAVAKTSSLVIYGEPQSGKTEMMICLTGKLLDNGHSTIVHLLNDSVDLLNQNLKRFRSAALTPGPKGLSELLQSSDGPNPQEVVVFCKKNRRDLEKLIARLSKRKKVLVIDDEADYATPNAKVNQGKRTTINRLVGQLIGTDGYYIGVTATPARLDLNNTFANESEKWVNFPPHKAYTGQAVFFPLDLTPRLKYRLAQLPQGGDPDDARGALVRFLVTVAYLNSYKNKDEQNYTMLVHTSGKKSDHEADRDAIEKAVHALIDRSTKDFDEIVKKVYKVAQTLFPAADANRLTKYVVDTAARAVLVVLNSERDRKALGDSATDPSSPFTIIVGGNIVSRGVTFPNLLSMFFTRSPRQKIQQDTYIQRARMFGAREPYLKYFELTIPAQLFTDWHRCFVFHKLALATIKDKRSSPVWIGDRRVAVAADSSIDRTTVVFDKGEMSFALFDYSPACDEIVLKDQTSIETLKKLSKKVGSDALPSFLIQYIEAISRNRPELLAIHRASSIANYKTTADQKAISRVKGFIGNPQLETAKFPHAVHHVKIFYNAEGKAKVFYKFKGSLQFVQNIKSVR